jgi:predicted NUDIX family phosphoesterase
MSIVGTERVLVVPTELFHELGYFEGFTAHIDGYLEELLSPQHTSYRPRSEMEQDPGYKQLIPYVIFRYTDELGRENLFRYTRGTGQGEQRLHSKHSIGIGGHISSDDADGSRKRGQEPFAGNRPSGCFAQMAPDPFFSNPFFSDAPSPYDEGMRRELAEEVFIETEYNEHCVGLINDDQTDVGKVHLGVVHIFDVESPKVRPRESEIEDARFVPVDVLLSDLDGFESWSQICLEALFAAGGSV